MFPLAASRQLRRALTIRYRDSSVDSIFPELASIKAAPRANVASIIIRFYIDAIRKAFEGPESKGPKNPWPKKGVQPVTGMGVAGSVIRIEGGLRENSDSIPGRPADDNASVAAHSSGSAAPFEHHGWISYLDIWQSASQPKGRLLNQGAALQESFSS